MNETFYPVNNICPCIRGEGALAGVAMVSVCLQGCDVRCPWCDRKYTWDVKSENERGWEDAVFGENSLYLPMTGSQIIEHIRKTLDYGMNWVLITGGEPTIHDLNELTINLMACKYSIALETSGLRYQDCMKCMDWITISPKMWRGFDDVDSLVVGIAHEIKFVISSVEDLRRAFDFVKKFHISPTYTICLQPANMNAEMMKLCYNTVIDQGWRLAVSLDKLITID